MISRPRARLRGALVIALAAGLGLLLGGCGGGTARAQKEIVLLRTDAPLREPMWVQSKDFTLALREDRPQVVRLTASSGDLSETATGPEAVTRSEEIGGVGGDMALNALKADQVYLPQPDLRRVILMNTIDLRAVRGFDLNQAPGWVAVHPGSQTLFALSGDGSTVSTVDLKDPTKTFDFRINAGRGARIAAPERGLDPEFWTWGPAGIAHYAGFPPERKVGLPINARAFAVDIETAQRAYVGEGTSGRVVAVEGDAAGMLEGKLEQVAQRDLGQAAEHLEVEDTRVFAATRDKLFQMRRDNLGVLQTTDFRRFLEQQGLGDARISGMTVTGDSIYLTLEGEPYILSIRKTDKTRA